jgi:hypothetical protein
MQKNENIELNKYQKLYLTKQLDGNGLIYINFFFLKKKKIHYTQLIIHHFFFYRDFLTGFHKRKLERKAKAKENALQFSKQERAKARKAVRKYI